MEKAYKFRFYPTKTQITMLNCTFGCVRYVYNHFLDLKQKLYNKEKKSMSYRTFLVERVIQGLNLRKIIGNHTEPIIQIII